MNIFALNNRALKYMKQKLTDLKGKREKSTMKEISISLSHASMN